MRISDWSSDVCSSDLVSTSKVTDADPPSVRPALSSFATGASSLKTRFWPMFAVALAVSPSPSVTVAVRVIRSSADRPAGWSGPLRSEEHTSELQSLMRISYAVFCLKKKKTMIIKEDIQYTKQSTQ